MGARDFWDAVKLDPDLEMASCVEGATPADDYVDVRHMPTGGGSRIPMSEICRVPAEDLVAVIKYERPSRIMKAVTGDAGSYGSLPAVLRCIAPVAVAS